jgi:DNA-binding transcriptional MocR family regulator
MPRARYKELVDVFAADIRSGKLPPGTRLPTHRQLAATEGLALATATRVFAELETMGLVAGETGRGTFVRETSLPPGLGIDQQTDAADMVDLNFNYASLPGQADLLRVALRQVAASGDIEALLRYQPHGGRPHERVIIAKYLLSQGLTVNAGQVMIVDGAQHGLATTVMALLKPGDVVVTEALTYSGFKVLAQALGLELVPLPVNEEGPDLDALALLCTKRRVKAVYIQPTLHNPMGWVMSLSERKKIVAIARQHDLLIIEDAAYAFLLKNPPPPVAHFFPENTIYVSSFSKSVATGLRVGLVAAPMKWVPKIERAIRATTWNTPAVMTAIACRWLENGTVHRLEREKRKDAMQRQAIAAEVFKGLNYIGHASSYFMWLPLGEEVRADQVAKELITHRISVSTAEPFTATPQVPHAIRLALGSVDLVTLRHALTKVKEVIEQLTYLH